MKYECDAVIEAGKINGIVYIYDEKGDLAYTVDAPLAEIKQRARAIVDWLNGLDDEAQRLAFCSDCGYPIFTIHWEESGIKEFDFETGKWDEGMSEGSGYWRCPCGNDLDYHDLCKIGVFGSRDLTIEQTWPIWTLSESDIVGVYEQELSGVGACPEYDNNLTDILDINEVARVFKEAISNSLGEGYDWQLMLRDAIEEVMK